MKSSQRNVTKGETAYSVARLCLLAAVGSCKLSILLFARRIFSSTALEERLVSNASHAATAYWIILATLLPATRYACLQMLGYTQYSISPTPGTRRPKGNTADTLHYEPQEDDEPEVEQILDERGNGYLVKWKGYPAT